MVTRNRVLLVCPPFHSCRLSSLSIAHLATWLHSQGVDAVESYPHIDFAKAVGAERYGAAGRDSRANGELLFAEGLHGRVHEPHWEEQLRSFGEWPERQALRDAFVRTAVREILASDAEYVGFTTSFNQLMASLLLARETKRLAPDRKIVLGGAACHEPMGTRILEGYPYVDYVVSGAGEYPLLDLGQGRVPSTRLVASAIPIDLDRMPIPEYGPFLAKLEAVSWSEAVALTFETSRGCWWGQKNHCRFCGVNGSSMTFSAKSGTRAVTEIHTLWQRYRRNLLATDSILPLEYHVDVVPRLMAEPDGPKIFYELKSPMTEEQIADLSAARVQGQPGLESLSTNLLRLLGKGSSAIRNVAFLKWSREHGLAVEWNQLYAIPGETAEDYDAQIQLMKRIVHLAPPSGAYPVRIARYSPYFNRFREFGWSRLRPTPEYALYHPHLGADARDEIAAFFDGEDGPDRTAYETRFREAVANWVRDNARGDGLFLHPAHGLVRNDAGGGFKFTPNSALDAVLRATHSIVSVERVLAETHVSMGFIEEMQRLGMVFVERGKIINLAVRLGMTGRRQTAS